MLKRVTQIGTPLWVVGGPLVSASRKLGSNSGEYVLQVDQTHSSAPFFQIQM